jgi:hypothetical protein
MGDLLSAIFPIEWHIAHVDIGAAVTAILRRSILGRWKSGRLSAIFADCRDGVRDRMDTLIRSCPSAPAFALVFD